MSTLRGERERERERGGRKGGREGERGGERGGEREKVRRNSHTHKQGIHSNYYNYVKIFRTTHKINSEGFTHKAWDNPNPLKLNVYKQDHN